MNNLSELQGELHKLSAALDALSRQVEDLKPREADETQDFSALEALARQDPIKNPTLAKAGEFERDLYLRMASTAAFLEDAGRLDKLLYLCRLAAGSGCGQSAAELQKMAYDTERLDWQSAAGELKGMALPLLLDMMMLGSMAGPAGERTLDFIASVAELMDVSEEDVTITAQLAAALLAQDEEKFRKIEAKRAYPELGYLVPEEWLINERHWQEKYVWKAKRELVYAKKDWSTVKAEYCLGFDDSFEEGVRLEYSVAPSELKKTFDSYAEERFKSGAFVKSGDILVSYIPANLQDMLDFYVKSGHDMLYNLDRAIRPIIIAKETGILFLPQPKNAFKNPQDIFIVSPFDNEEAFLTWYKQQKK